MRYIVVEFSNGYAGCDSQEYLIFSDNTTDSEIDVYCSEMLYEYAETYSYVARGWGNNWTEEDEDLYYENCTFNWLEVDFTRENINDTEWTRVN